MRRGRDSAFGNGYSFTVIVFGSILATLFVPNRTMNGSPAELNTIPYGSDRGVGMVINLMAPLFGSSVPTMFACCTVNHSRPLRPNSGVCGSRAAGSGIGYSVTSPVFGFSLPTSAFELPVYQMLPSLSAVSPCGPDPGVFSGNSLRSPLFGSTRPRTFAHCPVHQIAPSSVARGSCGREPRDGTIHSLNDTCTLPGTITDFGRFFSGKCVVRYERTAS